MAAVAPGSRVAASCEADAKLKQDLAEDAILADLRDDRLHGREDALYFVLRGHGLPTQQARGGSSGQCILVARASHPGVFRALARLGMRPQGDVMTLASEARECAAAAAPEARPVLCRPPRADVVPDAASCWGMSPEELEEEMRRAARSISPQAQRELFLRLAQPKHASRKHPFLAALKGAYEAALMEQALEERPDYLDRRRAAAKPGQVASLGKAGYQSVGRPSQAPEGGISNQKTDRGEPAIWTPPPVRVKPDAQGKYCESLAKPRVRNYPLAQSRLLPRGRPKGRQTPFGAAAQADLSRRMEIVKSRSGGALAGAGCREGVGGARPAAAVPVLGLLGTGSAIPEGDEEPLASPPNGPLQRGLPERHWPPHGPLPEVPGYLLRAFERGGGIGPAGGGWLWPGGQAAPAAEWAVANPEYPGMDSFHLDSDGPARAIIGPERGLVGWQLAQQVNGGGRRCCRSAPALLR